MDQYQIIGKGRAEQSGDDSPHDLEVKVPQYFHEST